LTCRFYNFIRQLKRQLEKIVINTPGFRSQLLVGGNWENAVNLLPEQGVVIITDDNVLRIYGEKFPQFPVFSITPGEESKKIKVVEQLAEKLLETGIDRSGFILAVGGGVVSDLAGFLASIYMRGIRSGFISTTLLSQVDASTGGKNGVNLGDTKNILGTFTQPEFVICDPELLQTLPEREYLSGLAELIKTAVIGDKYLFDLIEKSVSAIEKRDNEILTDLVAKSVRFKALVVSEDEKETGVRRILNFGHTFGHAIEMYSSVHHGLAVAAGMELATEYSFMRGLIGKDEKEKIINILKRFGLLEEHNIPDNQIERYILHDKKKTGSEIYFIFTEGIGNAFAEKIPVREVIDFYKHFKK
jgi:3-dehydroquinate synthase